VYPGVFWADRKDDLFKTHNGLRLPGSWSREQVHEGEMFTRIQDRDKNRVFSDNTGFNENLKCSIAVFQGTLFSDGLLDDSEEMVC